VALFWDAIDILSAYLLRAAKSSALTGGVLWWWRDGASPRVDKRTV
jgi:hypothetical protein